MSILSLDFAAIDKPTIIIVLGCQFAVVIVLFLLYRLYKFLFPVKTGLLKKRSIVNKITEDGKPPYKENERNVNAAIAMALYLHFNEMHDEESNVITIQRVSKTYSPWSSKIYNMRNFRK